MDHHSQHRLRYANLSAKRMYSETEEEKCPDEEERSHVAQEEEEASNSEKKWEKVYQSREKECNSEEINSHKIWIEISRFGVAWRVCSLISFRRVEKQQNNKIRAEPVIYPAAADRGAHTAKSVRERSYHRYRLESRRVWRYRCEACV